MYRYSFFDKKNLDDESIKKYGHKWYKEYEDGDENRVVFPERDKLSGNNMILYHRYKIATVPFSESEKHDLVRRGYDLNKKYVYMTFCHCNHYGNLCSDCKMLNTTEYLGLSVPLCREDFISLRQYVFEICGWNEINLYEWIEFWIEEFQKYRYDYKRGFVFWKYEKFKYMTLFKFFRYLFYYVIKKNNRSIYGSYLYKEKPMERRISEKIAEIRSGNAMIKLSMDIYHNSNKIINIIRTKNHKWNRIYWENNDHKDTFQKIQTPYRSIFDDCINEIKNEVAFRPGKWKMLEAESHFCNLLPGLKK